MSVTFVSLIVVAGGIGSRFGAKGSKQLHLVNGRPILWHSVEAFRGLVDEIILVVRPEDIESIKLAVKADHYVQSGSNRTESVRNGLLQVDQQSELIIIHDGARPCIEKKEIKLAIKTAEQTGAAVVAVPVKDTIKTAGADLIIGQTLDRETLWSVQTPQVFRLDLINKAYQQSNLIATDDAVLVERMGYPVQIVPGSYANIKLTTPEDLVFIEKELERRMAHG